MLSGDKVSEPDLRAFGSHPADDELWRRLGRLLGLHERGVLLRREIIQKVQELATEWVRDVQKELPADPPAVLRAALAACLPPGWDWWHGLARRLPIDGHPDPAVEVDEKFGWQEGVVPDRSGSGWLAQAALVAPNDDALMGVASVLDGALIATRDALAWEISDPAGEGSHKQGSPCGSYVAKVLDSSTILFTAYTKPTLQDAVETAVQPLGAERLTPLVEVLLDEALKGSRGQLEVRRGWREQHPQACGTPDELMLVRHFVVPHWPKASKVPSPTQEEVDALCDEIDLLAPWRTIGQRPDYDALWQADGDVLRRFESLVEAWDSARSE